MMKNIPIDKQAHFWAGAAICATTIILTGVPASGFFVGVLFALGKELLDKWGGIGRAEAMDAVATMLGAAIPALIAQMT